DQAKLLNQSRGSNDERSGDEEGTGNDQTVCHWRGALEPWAQGVNHGVVVDADRDENCGQKGDVYQQANEDAPQRAAIGEPGGAQILQPRSVDGDERLQGARQFSIDVVGNWAGESDQPRRGEGGNRRHRHGYWIEKVSGRSEREAESGNDEG